MANPGFICLLFNCTHVSSGNSDLNNQITDQNIIYSPQPLLQPQFLFSFHHSTQYLSL